MNDFDYDEDDLFGSPEPEPEPEPEKSKELATPGYQESGMVTMSNPTPGPMDLVAIALDKKLDTDIIEKLMDLQDRNDQKLAKIAYEKAMVRFSSICPPIKKTGDGDRYRFPKFPIIMDTIRPFLSDCGLSVRFRKTTNNQEGWAATTCIVSHEGGHSEESEFDAPIDDTRTSQGKELMNKTQRMGSTNSYIKRYALADALNLSFYDDSDDDGLSASQESKPTLTDRQAVSIQDEVDAGIINLEKFLIYMGSQFNTGKKAFSELSEIPAEAWPMIEAMIAAKHAQKENQSD